MALPTLADVKALLRVEHAQEDTLITSMLARAKAMVFGYLNRPVVTAEKTFRRLIPRTSEDGYEILAIPEAPISGTAADVVVTNDDAATVMSTDYSIDSEMGWLFPIPMLTWGRWPYTVVAKVGLVYHPDYATIVEPAISQAIVDVVSDLYQRRNPAATNESGAGVSTSYGSSGLPTRVEEALAMWRRRPRV